MRVHVSDEFASKITGMMMQMKISEQKFMVTDYNYFTRSIVVAQHMICDEFNTPDEKIKPIPEVCTPDGIIALVPEGSEQDTTASPRSPKPKKHKGSSRPTRPKTGGSHSNYFRSMAELLKGYIKLDTTVR